MFSILMVFTSSFISFFSISVLAEDVENSLPAGFDKLVQTLETEIQSAKTKESQTEALAQSSSHLSRK